MEGGRLKKGLKLEVAEDLWLSRGKKDPLEKRKEHLLNGR